MTKIPIEMDKCLHFMAGIAVYALSVLLLSPGYAMGCVMVAGAGKELWDHYHPNHTVDWHDFKWTVFGGLVFHWWLQLYGYIQGEISLP